MVLNKSDFGKHFFRIYSEDSKRQESKGLHKLYWIILDFILC